MKKPLTLTILIWDDNSCAAEFQTTDESWLETSHIKIIEGTKLYSYDSSRSKGTTISFTYNSEGLIKEFFNVNSMMIGESK